MNACAGRPAVVIGKGPTLDAWLAAGCPQPAGAVTIGINQVAWVVPGGTTWSLAHREWMRAEVPTQWVTALPYPCPPPQGFHWTGEVWRKPALAAQWFLHVHGEGTMHLPREEIADTHILCNFSSHAQPAVHFAWYLGCSSLLLVGIDGTGYTQQPLAGATNDAIYTWMKGHTVQLCDHLYGRHWSHWAP